jgi:hypothetical protein
MRNPAFERAVQALMHPVSLSAVVVLLINDHLLRWRWPSWWTGKIGDVAWLIFAPALLAALLAWFAPQSLRRFPTRLGGLALALVGGAFVLVKTLPAAHVAFQHLYNGLLPWDSMLRRDPSDLLALPALFIAAWVWRRPRLRWSKRSLPRRAWLIISLATLATVANSAAPDLGITCLAVTDDRIEAYHIYSYNEIFVSRDGGLTWQATDVETPPVDLGGCENRPDRWTIETPNAHYRFTQGESIERSTDGGQTWQIEFELGDNEPRIAYYRKTRSSIPLGASYPKDAVWDPESDHVIAAMGQDGVLVRTPEDGWRWVTVGRYQFESPTRLRRLAVLLQGEMVLAGFLAALLFNTWCARGTRRWLISVLIIGWALWLLTVLWKPALKSNYDGFITVFLHIGAGVFVVPLSILHIVQLIRKKRTFHLWTALLLIAAGLLFLMPYVGWTLGILSRYNTALIVAVSIALSFAAIGVYFSIRMSSQMKRPVD